MMMRITVAAASLLFSTVAWAGCDPCIQAAAQTANSQMTAAINNATASVQANVSATQALNASIQATDAAWQAAIQLNSTNYLQALDAATSRVELTQSQLLKTEENLSDHEVQSIAKMFEELYNAEQAASAERMLRPELAQPMSGDIGANRAPLLKRGMVQADQQWRRMDENFATWSETTETVNSAGEAITTAMLLTEEENVFDVTPLLTSDALTEEQSLDLQKLLTLLVNPVPEKKMTDEQMARDPKAARKELERKLKNAKLTMAYSVLAKGLSEREAVIPISPDDWQMGYTTARPNADGNTSYHEFIESETVGRMASEGWYQDIKTKTDAGVLREQVYQQAMNNHLLYKSVQQEEQQLLLLAIIAAEENRRKER